MTATSTYLPALTGIDYDFDERSCLTAVIAATQMKLQYLRW